MKLARFLLALVLVALATPAHAQNYAPQAAIADYATFHSGNWSSPQTQVIQLLGHNAAGDGGDGVYKSMGTTICTTDGGATIKDGKGNCYSLVDFRGDLRQYGATLGSTYNCSPTTGVGIGSCTDALALINAMWTEALARGKTNTTTGGVQIHTSASITAPTNMSLDCGAVFTGKNNDTGLYNDVPGSIYVAHGASLLHATGSGYHNCAVVSADYESSAPWHTIPDIGAYWGQGGTAQTDGDTGVICNVSACSDSFLQIIGFDTCWQNSHSGDTTADNITGDCNVGVAAYHNLGARKYSKFNIFPFTTHQLDGITDGSGGSSYNDSNTEWWTINNIVDDGTGQCKLQFTDHSTADIHTGDLLSVNNISSRESCWGLWTVTVSSGAVILNGSSYAGPTTTGSFTAGRNSIFNIASMANVFVGQTITGVSGIVDGSVIVARDKIANWVAISCDAAGNVCVTGSGSGVSITFANDTSSTFKSVTCDGNKGTCAWLSYQSRLVAGTSQGGLQAGGIATGYMVGGSSSSDKDAGFTGSDLRSYGHEIQFHFENASDSNVVLFSGDTDGNTDNPDQIGTLVDGDSTTVTMAGKGTGKVGIGILVNSTNSDQRALHVSQSGNDATSAQFTAFEIDDGSAEFSGDHGTSGSVVVSHLAGPTFFNANIYPHTDLYYENDAAQGMVQGGGNAFSSGYVPTQNNNTASAKAGTTGTVVVDTFTITGASLDTTGIQPGMQVIGPKSAIQNGTEVDTVTAMPCIPSCSVTMTNIAKASTTATFKFTGIYSPGAPIAGAVSRSIQQDGLNAYNETDAFAGAPGASGVRSEGTMASPTAVQTGAVLNHTGGRGYGATGYPANDNAAVEQQACENFTDSAQCAANVFKATEKGKTTTAEVGRVESGGIGIKTGTGVIAPLEILPSATTFTTSTINALGASSTGDITINVGATVLPSPGTAYCDSELFTYTVTSSTHLNVTSRARFGTTGATHANGITCAFVEILVGSGTSAAPALVVLSNGTSFGSGTVRGAVSPTATTSTAITTAYEYWPCDATSGTVVMTLPSAAAPNLIFAIPKMDATANACRIATTGGDTIVGYAAPMDVTLQGDDPHLKSDGVSKWILE